MLIDSLPKLSLYVSLAALLAPLAAFGAIMIFLRRFARLCAVLSISAVTVSLFGAIFLLIRHWDLKTPMEFTLEYILSGNILIPAGILIDPLSLLMLIIAVGVSFLVQIYSLGYMAGDPGFARYYGYMSLFVWSMSSLALAPTALQLYIFWELVGLSSYLLIGFWFEKFSASKAGKKAFIMTRIGDVAFFLGLLILLVYGGTLHIVSINKGMLPKALPPDLITLSALLIFGGIIGKSAQFPLMTWLPDAMEGPTPVSALLHSATMVAAGVFLFGRLFPFFSLSHTAMTITLAIATISMLMSATMAMVSRDIKKVWAYSTISQLGFMIMGLGAGGYMAGVFHLTTHAGFKALLFLCAGVFIHAFETNDMFTIGTNNGRAMKIPMICMVVGAAALSGIWPLSGFFSKEMIMAQLCSLQNPIWALAGFVGIFLTAYYTFRLIFIIMFPRRIDSGNHTAHAVSLRSNIAMLLPLIVLAALTLMLGFGEHGLAGFIQGHGQVQADAPGWLLPLSIILVALAVGTAWYEFGRKGCRKVGFVERMPRVSRFFENRWYLDDLYEWIYREILVRRVAQSCRNGDLRVIDGLVERCCDGIVAVGRKVASGHGVLIQFKLAVIFSVVFSLTVVILTIG